MHILNTKPFLYDSRGLRCLQYKMGFLTHKFINKMTHNGPDSLKVTSSCPDRPLPDTDWPWQPQSVPEKCQIAPTRQIVFNSCWFYSSFKILQNSNEKIEDYYNYLYQKSPLNRTKICALISIFRKWKRFVILFFGSRNIKQNVKWYFFLGRPVLRQHVSLSHFWEYETWHE